MNIFILYAALQNRRLQLFSLFIIMNMSICYAQLKEADVHNLYLQGLQYKNGNGVEMDYSKAFLYFNKASSLGDQQATYAVAYMLYKGLGCNQNYDSAAVLFSKGAFLERDNSMYFYGLCWRNGYGVTQNKDSAMYWLEKSANTGYKLAKEELNSLAPENLNDSLARFISMYRNAALPQTIIPNSFIKLPQSIPQRELLSGRFSGRLIQYDWSGKNIVSWKKLSIELENRSPNIQGRWIEEQTDSINFLATFDLDSLKFNNTSYRRMDHYSPDSAINYNFSTAKLQVITRGDTLFLAGTIDMYSPDRKEPSKPLLLAVSKVESHPIKNDLSVKIFPNPFNSLLNISFYLTESSDVSLQLVGIDGKVYYSRPANRLTTGSYQFSMQPPVLTAGVYFVSLIINGKPQSFKVVKL